MVHVGLDYHKKYSYAVALDDSGEVVWEGQLANTPEAFANLRERLGPGPVQSVTEAGWNWGIAFELLERAGLNPILANTHKMRIIAETYVKTDKIDATAHAEVLRLGRTPRVHVPTRRARDQKNLLRRRIWLVRLRTALKNRIHSTLDRNHAVPPEMSDLFGMKGRAWMKSVALPPIDTKILGADTELFEFVQNQIRQTEKWIDQELKGHELMGPLMSLPGVGKVLAAIIALEVDTIDRFVSAAKLGSYSGLTSSTYSSGGKTRHGGTIPTSNRFLTFAFVEASWTAINTSPYFGAFYKRLKARIGTQKAIVATARKLCEVAYHCMRERRDYVERPYQFKSGRLGRVLA